MYWSGNIKLCWAALPELAGTSSCSNSEKWLDLIFVLWFFLSSLFFYKLHETYLWNYQENVKTLSCFTGQQQGQDGVKVQQATIAPVTVAVGGIANAAIGAVSPDQITQVQLQQAQQASDQEAQPGKRLRRVACSCPNCREGEGRWV